MRYQSILESNCNTALTPIGHLQRKPKLFAPSPIILLMLAACSGGYKRVVSTEPTSLDPDLLSGFLSVTTDENNQDFSHSLPSTAGLGGNVTLSLAAGENDNDFFVVDSSGNLILRDDADASQVFDHETAPNQTSELITVTISEEYFYELYTGTNDDDIFAVPAVVSYLRWDGLGGEDTVTYIDAPVPVIVDFTKGSDELPTAVFGSGHFFTDVENIIGSGFDDSLTGDDGANTLEGGAGADRLDGGAGTDKASYASSNEGVTINLATGVGSGGHADGDTLSNIENLIGSRHADSLTGDDGANALEGGDGNDTLKGGAGNDRLDGQAGDNILTGGAGNDSFDTYFASDQVESITDFTKGEDKIRITVSDTSAVTDLNSLFDDIFVEHFGTTITDYTDNGKNDTVLRFDKSGVIGENAGDYILVLEGFTSALEYSDFSII